MHRKYTQTHIPGRRSPRKHPAGKLLTIILSLALITCSALFLSAPPARGDSVVAAPGFEGLKPAVAGYAAHADEGLSAPEVVSFLNDFGAGAGVADISPFGPEYTFNSGASSRLSAVALSASKFVVAYSDAGNVYYGTAIIGDVTGNAIAYGSEYVFNAASTYDMSLATLSASKFTLAYRDASNSNYGTTVIGDISGTSIVYGSEYVFNPGISYYISTTALSASKFVVAYSDAGNSDYGAAVIGDVTGNVVAFGSEYVFNPAQTINVCADALSADKFVVSYGDIGNSYYGTAVIGDVTGNTIAYRSENVFNPSSTDRTAAMALTDNDFAIAYNSYHGAAVIGKAPPDISVMTPSEGKIGTQVDIGGIGFGATRGTSYVEFGSVQATDYISWSDTQVVCKVPAGSAGEVNVKVTTTEGTSNGVAFEVTPHISALSPKSGTQGTQVMVTGSGFGATRGTSYVTFGGVKATNYVFWSATGIVVKVPAGAAGAINAAVTTSGGRSNLSPFKVIPHITKISPLSGTPGTQVTITGTGFGSKRGTSTVKFGITAVTDYVSWSNTRIVVKVPTTGTGSKLVKVTTTGGTSAGVSFTVN